MTISCKVKKFLNCFFNSSACEWSYNRALRNRAQLLNYLLITRQVDKSNNGELLNDNRVLNRVHRRCDQKANADLVASTPAPEPLHIHTTYDVHIVVVGATKKRSTFALLHIQLFVTSIRYSHTTLPSPAE